MKAVRFHRFGPPEVLQVDAVEVPIPRSGDALVRVQACATNWRDVDQRRGTYGMDVPLPYCPGIDVVGVVESVGADDANSFLGRRVVIYPTLSCGSCTACRAGLDNRCSVVRTAFSGGYAELVLAPVRNLVVVPHNVDAVSLAALPTTYLTAWHALMTRARLAAGDVVLVIGAGGGVATAAIQIAVLAGARCLVATRDPERLSSPFFRRVEVFRSDSTLVEQVLEATDGEGVDFAIDPLGGQFLPRVATAVRLGGTIMSYGWLLGAETTIDLSVLARREIAIVGTRLGCRSEFDHLLALFLRNTLSPLVHAVMPLEDAAKAHRILEEGRHAGKVVLTP